MAGRTAQFLAAITLAFGLAATFSGCSGDSETTSMRGRIVAPECAGGYDLEATQVTLRNESDEIIGTGNTSINLVDPLTEPCVVSFTISDVPDAKFYSIKVGTHDGPAWAVADLRAQKFRPDLTLGDSVMPEADSPAFCDSMESLRSVFDDIDMLNDDPDAWDTQVHAYATDIRGYAAGLLVEGGQGVVADQAIEAGTALLKVEGFVAASALNKKLEPFNDAVRAAYQQADCGYWEDVSYSAA